LRRTYRTEEVVASPELVADKNSEASIIGRMGLLSLPVAAASSVPEHAPAQTKLI